MPGGSSPHTRGARAARPATRKGEEDHPRIRGEHITDREPATPTQGSSPHTRGAREGIRSDLRRLWIIPAYAGSTRRLSVSRALLRDHPRIRGEHSGHNPHTCIEVPSSPHTRGALAGGHVVGGGVRIIPAYAGSTTLWSPATVSSAGSSPHTRGAQRRPLLRRPPARIIPAYAGSTSPPYGAPPAQPDHPRIRGEHPYDEHCVSYRGGSSPHTRGARRPSSASHGSRRIIPAYAGSTPTPATETRGSRDHPRIRGEHEPETGADESLAGSSPHTRGAPAFRCRPGLGRRIIPAYAGSTPGRPPARDDRADHPRIRGEHADVQAEHDLGAGSSPHTRGARRTRRPADRAPRIIPAYAGSTVACEVEAYW